MEVDDPWRKVYFAHRDNTEIKNEYQQFCVWGKMFYQKAFFFLSEIENQE